MKKIILFVGIFLSLNFAKAEDFKILKEELKKHEEEYSMVKNNIESAESQLKIINHSIKETQNTIKKIKNIIEETLEKLTNTTNEVEAIKIENQNQKELMIDIFNQFYFEEITKENDIESNWRKEQIKKLYEINNKKISSSNVDKKEKEKKLDEISINYNRLNNLNNLYKKEKKDLDLQLITQKILLKTSYKTEEYFKELIEETRLQMQESQNIASSVVIAKPKENRVIKMNFNPDDKDINFIWPINPKKGISAFFMDESYKKIFKMEHKAIDIPTPQRTEILSPATGKIYKTADNGMGYSYIMIKHENNIMTVYGHVNEILVEENQIVKQGEIIGLSGGKPGTRGAGWMTTGPHLHFEVFKNGKPIDPLTVLPEMKN